MSQIKNAKEFFDKKRGNANDPRDALFNHIVQFMDAIAANDHGQADEAVQNIIRDSQGGLYKEVGKVTRKLHDSIKNFKDGIDPKIRALAINDMPSAVDKLEYVIAKTEDAANKTMAIVDKYLLAMDSLGDHIKRVDGPAETTVFLERFKSELEQDLITILTTQQFQDLTGQNIKKVITLVAEIEHELIKLITTFGDINPPDSAIAAVPVEQPETVSQAGIDDLLKELGF